MKKTLTALLCVMMMTALFGCTKKEETPSVVESTTPAAILKDYFDQKAPEKEWTTEELANEMASNEVIQFGPIVDAVKEGYVNGFKADITGFDEGYFFGPMIGSIPFVGYIFKVSGDKDALTKQLEENYDLAWNVCTQADEMALSVSGDFVFFVMAPASFDE